MTTTQIIIICLLYWFGNCVGLGAHLSLTFFAYVNGFWCGLILGDWKTGLMLGAAIQTLNMAPVTTGATNSYDLGTATFVAVPLAMEAGLSADVALTLAIPFAVIAGALYTPFEKTINSFITNLGDKAAAKGDIAAMGRTQWLISPIIMFPGRFIPLFLILSLGSAMIDKIIALVPAWVMAGLGTAGGVLPCVGFAMFLNIIGKKDLLVYFFLGFYAEYCFGFSTMILAIFGVIIAILHGWFVGDKEVA